MSIKPGTKVTGHITNQAGRTEFSGEVIDVYQSNRQTIVLVDCEDGVARSALEQNVTPVEAAKPEWRTLKGVTAPFLVHAGEVNGYLYTAGDRKAPAGEPLKIVRLETRGGLRYGYTEDGRKISFSGVATKMWVTQ